MAVPQASTGYHPGTGEIVECDIIKNSAAAQVVLPSNRSDKAIKDMLHRSISMLETYFENSRLRSSDYAFLDIENITVNIYPLV